MVLEVKDGKSLYSLLWSKCEYFLSLFALMSFVMHFFFFSPFWKTHLLLKIVLLTV